MNRKYFNKWPNKMYIKHIKYHSKHDKHDHLHMEHHNHYHHHHHQEFYQFQRYLKWLRPITFLIPIAIIYFIFKFIGVKAITIFIAIVFGASQVIHLLVLLSLEKRIIKPIEKLQKGVEQISSGNYEVRIENDIFNEIGVLIGQFNDMAQKLEKGEKAKQEYENNRKALIANISHDLKTPITSVSGYIEAILDGVVTSPEKISSYLKIVESNINYINKLIDDLFLFSKLDLQKLEFKFQIVKIKSFMQDLMEEFKFTLGEKNIIFNFYDNIEEELQVNIDGKRIYQAMRNIIGNAVKYGAVNNLSINTELIKKGNFIKINIEDNGPGIEKDKLPHIFDRFYRVDTERTKDLMSTGLGLAIAREIIEAHGGSISVYSVLNEGSTFTIMLPIMNS
ncbi:sensor histidine kinase [Clostridium sp. WILCCON 0269]|uniref:histidine kinase n=1 Tax=Candidatus Clostridium eludens TaxID=3381663 RepID=A0ABW8SLQ1_9CLOT